MPHPAMGDGEQEARRLTAPFPRGRIAGIAFDGRSVGRLPSHAEPPEWPRV